MSENNSFEQAKDIYERLCKELDAYDWKYKKDEEELSIECGAQGDDLPMKITIKVDAKRMLVLLFSHLPVVIKEDKRLDLAVAISAINNLLVDGCFDYDIKTGHIFFRMTNSFIENKLGDEVFSYMLLCSFKTIDEFNDKLLMLAKGMLSVEKFIETINN